MTKYITSGTESKVDKKKMPSKSINSSKNASTGKWNLTDHSEEPTSPLQQIKSNIHNNTFNNNILTQFTKYQNLGEGYEEYVKSLGTIVDNKLDPKNGTKIHIPIVMGNVIQVKTINFQEFTNIAQSKKALTKNDRQELPTKQDYIDKYNAKLQQQVTTPASTPSDQDSLLNEDEGESEQEIIPAREEKSKSSEGSVENSDAKTSMDDLPSTSTPKSQSFLSKIFGGMFESIGSFLGISGATGGSADGAVTPGDSDNTLPKLTGDTNTETPDNAE